MLDSLGRVDTSYNQGGSSVPDYYFHWEDENVVKQEYDFGTVIYEISYTYYTEYLNPFYQVHKNFKRNENFIPNRSTYNLRHLSYNNRGNVTGEIMVIESIGPYPTYLRYANSDTYIIIEYLEVITNIPETQSAPVTTLQTDYFDLYGRKIPKPNKGFYIERKITDKGIISKKYFVP